MVSFLFLGEYLKNAFECPDVSGYIWSLNLRLTIALTSRGALESVTDINL